MDDRARADANARLKRIAGQVSGIERMLADSRYCIDILLQIAAVQGALNEVGRVVLASHVETCLGQAFKTGNVKERQKKLAELMDIFSRCTIGGGVGRSRSRTRKPTAAE